MSSQIATPYDESNRLVWEEKHDCLLIRFPCPVGDGGSIPLWMLLTLVSMVGLISLFWLLLTFINEAQVSVAKELFVVAVLGVMLCVWPKAFRAARMSVHAP